MTDPAPRQDSTTIQIVFPIRTLLAVVLTVAACWMFLQLGPILAVLVGALMLAGALSPLVAWLEARRIRRTWALSIVFVIAALLLLVVALVTLPALWAEIIQTLEQFPALQQKLASALEARHGFSGVARTVRNFHLEKTASESGSMSMVATASLNVLEVAGYAGSAVILSIYFMADRDRMTGALYALVPKRFHVRLARVLLNLGTIVGGYIRGQIITSLAIAVFTFALLSVLHVRSALALAAFAGLTDVIPFVGGLLATAPAVLVALSRSPLASGIVLASLLAYQEFESRILVPRVYGKTLRLPSVAVVLALLVGGKLAGILGAFLALPVAAGLLMLIEELRVELPGVDTDDTAQRARDDRAEAAYEVQSAGTSAEDAAKVAVDIADQIHDADVATRGKAAPEVSITNGKPK